MLLGRGKARKHQLTATCGEESSDMWRREHVFDLGKQRHDGETSWHSWKQSPMHWFGRCGRRSRNHNASPHKFCVDLCDATASWSTRAAHLQDSDETATVLTCRAKCRMPYRWLQRKVRFPAANLLSGFASAIPVCDEGIAAAAGAADPFDSPPFLGSLEFAGKSPRAPHALCKTKAGRASRRDDRQRSARPEPSRLHSTAGKPTACSYLYLDQRSTPAPEVGVRSGACHI
eukprot:1330839-Pleurochrysis_carterae.AAC.7